MSSNEKKQRSILEDLCASSALLLTARMPRPVGSMKPFCEPDTQQSTPHSSMRKSMQPTELTPSTKRSAGCLASFSALRTPATSLVTPVAVSLWVAEPWRHVDPEQRELAEAAHEDFVAAVERIGDGGFPGAGAGGGVDEDAALGELEGPFQVLEQGLREL